MSAPVSRTVGAATLTSNTISKNYGTDLTSDNYHPATEGGGIFNQGTLTVSACTVSGNFANTGGGISNHGTATIKSSSRITGSSEQRRRKQFQRAVSGQQQHDRHSRRQPHQSDLIANFSGRHGHHGGRNANEFNNISISLPISGLGYFRVSLGVASSAVADRANTLRIVTYNIEDDTGSFSGADGVPRPGLIQPATTGGGYTGSVTDGGVLEGLGEFSPPLTNSTATTTFRPSTFCCCKKPPATRPPSIRSSML